ncbi:MAG: aldehyde dehydrogenase family protein [Bacteroidetes bacterium SW_9_63_38]|nr:MAG: aldehyde dehydrogenase family protein [Bacteroidetes bacterium SW_9_63_38]
MPSASASPSEPTSEDLSALLSTMQAHAPTVRDTSAAQRKAKLQRLADALLDRRAEIARALDADFGKAPVEVDLTEIKAVTKEAEFAIARLDDWMAPDPVDAPLLFNGTRSAIHYEPKGVVLILSPWNYPVNLTLGPLVAALAAGNCAVLKPSEHTPNTAAVLQDLIDDLFDDREVRVVQGGPDVAETLTHQPFDHIYFTGSPAIGRHVMRAAAEHLASVTLELGGKSPAVVDRTADLDRAAARIAWSKFTNAGQTCIAPDYVLVEQPVHDALVARLQDTIAQFYGATPAAQQAGDDYARLIHDDHYEAVVGLMDDAVEHGATVASGGQHEAESCYVAPTVLTDVPLDTNIMQDEIFGPLLPIVPFQTLDDALRIINDRPSPLSLYVFSERDATVDTVLGRTSAGSTCVNEGFLHFVNPNLPFGGKGESGIGRGHGYRGFREFSNERSVLHRTYGSGLIRTLYPPYDRLTTQVMSDWILRFF